MSPESKHSPRRRRNRPSSANSHKALHISGRPNLPGHRGRTPRTKSRRNGPVLGAPQDRAPGARGPELPRGQRAARGAGPAGRGVPAGGGRGGGRGRAEDADREAGSRGTCSVSSLTGQTCAPVADSLSEQFITQTFLHAGPNLSINGLDITSSHLSTLLDTTTTTTSTQPLPTTTTYEPFDARKRQRIDALTREEEDLLSEIASLKRAAPRHAAQRLEHTLRASVAADGAALKGAREAARTSAEAEAEEAGAVGGVKALERQGEVEAAFKRAVEGLEGLKRELPVAAARMERARVAGEYVLGSKA